MNPVIVLFFILSCVAQAAVTVVYSNDFDGNITHTEGATSVFNSSTGGAVDSQGYNGLTGFSGDFWRETSSNNNGK